MCCTTLASATGLGARSDCVCGEGWCRDNTVGLQSMLSPSLVLGSSRHNHYVHLLFTLCSLSCFCNTTCVGCVLCRDSLCSRHTRRQHCCVVALDVAPASTARLDYIAAATSQCPTRTRTHLLHTENRRQHDDACVLCVSSWTLLLYCRSSPPTNAEGVLVVAVIASPPSRELVRRHFCDGD